MEPNHRRIFFLIFCPLYVLEICVSVVSTAGCLALQELSLQLTWSFAERALDVPDVMFVIFHWKLVAVMYFGNTISSQAQLLALLQMRSDGKCVKYMG